QDANEELQATNEELMLTQEELQVTNEEFEATNEELRATNEELTNNEELQAINEELQTTKDELSARTVELQEVMKQYRMEQLQLSQLLERFPHFVMVVNADDLTVQTINTSYKQLLGNRDVAGLPVTELFSGDEVDQLTRTLKKAVRERQTIYTQPIHAGVADGRNYRLVHTVVPISDETGNNVNRLFIYSEKPE
ncbi:MAG TPA: PAS domain-containing protein, partial [Pyrinomonadaceae bacterium]|nr:PAS domain-containing protein [Pyrinomonadaceae bacterium]